MGDVWQFYIFDIMAGVVIMSTFRRSKKFERFRKSWELGILGYLKSLGDLAYLRHLEISRGLKDLESLGDLKD